ncbi:hypothetical protein [Collinsella sp. An2]|uniref:hypothetical protein n=1 Tax=Collinsella sp. An2 TaxID=1965585 RepID=UPI000B3984DA|nr:hypothetical protein [Collinsella sp. An2]OUP06024.1 hypothetical protein B5F33_10575 [Collinsella sp. An2]
MKSPRSIALDSNVLTLFIVGLYNRNAISKHRRLKAYEASHFDKLVALIESFDYLVTTPQSLAEVSNLLDFDKQSARHTMGLLKGLLQGASSQDEIHEQLFPSRLIVEEESYMWLGLADASFVQLAKRGVPVITADARLFARLIAFNSQCVNFITYAFS